MAKRRGVLVTFIVLGLIGLVAAVELKRQAISAQLEDITEHLQEMKFDDPTKNQETADIIVKELRNLMDIPEDIEPTVATIVDVEILKEKNPFYAKAENGDHLIVTPTRAILYSSKTKKIIDVVPVQLEPVAGEGSAEE
ncbi:MAG: hypothetical protein HN666_04130 [Candidatus Peribacter sp.]|nr:hypothetical protein [Candidatus Peribacter sp.]MBT7494397.1 hypothetical protein [Candidatus Peribacter sp.]